MARQLLINFSSERFKPLWILNSTIILFVSFMFTGVLLDLSFWLISNNIGLFSIFHFDRTEFRGVIDFVPRKVLILYSSVFLTLFILMFLNNIFYGFSRKHVNMLKLFFLWNYIICFSLILGYIAFAALGDRTQVRVGLWERKFIVLWGYMKASNNLLPFLTALCIAFFAISGSLIYKRFLSIAPSSKYTREAPYRLYFIINTVIVPFFLFTIFGRFFYPELPGESRYICMLIFWAPALVMLYRAYNTKFTEDRVLALQGSWIDYPDVIFMFLLIGGFIAVRFLIH